MGAPFAGTPAPPYVAAIFTNRLAFGINPDGAYAETAQAMADLAAQQPGYLGIESVRGADGAGITVSYWTDRNAVRAWRENAEHLAAQRLGRERFYDAFELRIATVEAARGWRRAGE